MNEEETRAEVARRRLAKLAEAFDAQYAAQPAPISRPATPRRLGPAHLRALLVAAVAGLVLVAWWVIDGRAKQSDPIRPLAVATVSATSATSSNSASGATAAELVVDVEGDVKRPGLVTLAAGARVNDAIEAAGGLAHGGSTEGLNLARKLTDGEQLVVGAPPAAQGASASASAPQAGAAVNLNTADLAALDTLPGVGPVTAQAIIDWRTANGGFSSVDDLLDVQGIGQATLDKLRDHVTVG